MKYIKTYEEVNSLELKDIKTQIEYAYIQKFESEDDYYEFCKEKSAVDDVDDVDWDYIPQDVIDELGLGNKFSEIDNETLFDMVTDIMTEIDLDNCDDVRNLTYDNYKNIIKYNL